MDLVRKLLAFCKYRGVPTEVVRAVLQGCDNDTRVATERLLEMGYGREGVLSALGETVWETQEGRKVANRERKQLPVPEHDFIMSKLPGLEYTRHGRNRSLQRKVSEEDAKKAIRDALRVGQVSVETEGHLKFTYAYWDNEEVNVVTDYEMKVIISVWIRELWGYGS